MRGAALAVAALVCFAATVQASEVVVFGDSWGAFSQRVFQQMFNKRGYDIDVDNTAIGGTTAEYWARNPDSLLKRVQENPDCKWVWLSIGGNDGIYGLSAGEPIDEVIARTINFTQVFLDPLFEARPDIQVVQFGYDIVDFGHSASCRNLGDDLFPWCSTTACKNNEMFSLQYDYVDELTKYYDNHISLNLLGSLQAARPNQIPAPYPNVDYYSPEDLMSDCIHPNDEGFDIIFDVMWDQYWAGQVGKMRRLK